MMTTSVPLTAELLRGWVGQLQGAAPVEDAERIEQLRALEELSCAAAGAQARIALELEASQLAAQRVAGVKTRDLGKGIGAQIGLARRVSPNRGARLLGLAHAVAEMPHTRAAWQAGQITEWRASILARETGCLSREDQGLVDAELAGLPGGLQALGDAGCEREARRIAYRLDPYAVTRRAAKAVTERTVSVRPAPDTMTYLTGLLPVRGGVGVFAALSAHADTLLAHGDERTRG